MCRHNEQGRSQSQGPHQRRDQHRADNDCRTVHIETDGGNEDRQHQDTEIRPPKLNASVDPLCNFLY